MKRRDRPAQLDIASSEIERLWVAFTEYRSTELSTLRNKKIATFIIVYAVLIVSLILLLTHSSGVCILGARKKLDSHSHDE